MKNVDVPMWDKGDSTDNYAKGGGRQGSTQGTLFGMGGKREKELKKIYRVVLGREPSTRELSYHRFSSTSNEEITLSLLSSEEHSKLIEKGQKYPELEKMCKLLEGNILKLRTTIDDKGKEMDELNNLLNEKSNLIEELRSSKDVPYVTDKKLLESEYTPVANAYYSNLRKETKKKYSFWEKVLNLFFGKNE
ncbi:MAG: hypothetical protein ACOX6Q_00410 [Candidatus Dojkabacteria bacterium]